MINKLDALTYAGDWRGELLLCTAYEDSTGRQHRHVPRNEAVRKLLRPVYARYPGWSEDVSERPPLPAICAMANARRYVAGMVKSVLDGWPTPGSRGFGPACPICAIWASDPCRPRSSRMFRRPPGFIKLA